MWFRLASNCYVAENDLEFPILLPLTPFFFHKKANLFFTPLLAGREECDELPTDTHLTETKERVGDATNIGRREWQRPFPSEAESGMTGQLQGLQDLSSEGLRPRLLAAGWGLQKAPGHR